jgi:hypothetical protein
MSDYCTRAKQSSQVCWDDDIMNSGFEYALNYLKNPSNDIIGKMATITANRANVNLGDIK